MLRPEGNDVILELSHFFVCFVGIAYQKVEIFFFWDLDDDRNTRWSYLSCKLMMIESYWLASTYRHENSHILGILDLDHLDFIVKLKVGSNPNVSL